MKKLVAVTIVLCLVFAAVVPCFAASDVVVTAFYNAASNTGINAGQLMQSLLNTIVAINSKLPAVTSTGTVFENIDTRLGHIESWLVPSNSAGTNPSLYQLILELGIAAQSYLPYIPTISSYVGNWMTTNNNNLSALVTSLTRQVNNSSYSTLRYTNAHSYLVDDTGKYSFQSISANGVASTVSGIPWSNGTPLGNIAYLLMQFNNSFVRNAQGRWAADLKHYNDTLTTWDSQGDTLTQVSFTPESAIQGLYRYLAFTQRDVARLTYVLASDQELEAREAQQAVTSEVQELFLDPDSNTSTQVADITNINTGSTVVRNNFQTGYDVNYLNSPFEVAKYTGSEAWFSVQTALNLGYDDVISSRKTSNSVYETPLLDAYYEEILSLGSDKK